MLTLVSLFLFLIGFVLIGMGAESKIGEHKGILSLLGFILVLITMVILGTIIVSQTLG